MITLEMILKSLVDEGCSPSIYRRGEVWRAHVNASKNFWADDVDPISAVLSAYLAWRSAGKSEKEPRGREGVSDDR